LFLLGEETPLVYQNVQEIDMEKQDSKWGCALKSCTCESQYQDQKYGKGVRVMNKKVKQGVSSGFCCTVCGKTKV
jgi:hypothetical protein